MQTKEKILWEALQLFSQRGYEAVSVRELAGAVGIRESSLYNHFKGKQDIFDSLVDACWERARDYFRQEGLPFFPDDDLTVFAQPDPAKLSQTLSDIFRYFFDDPWAKQFRKLLLLSQYSDPHAQELYRKLYRDYPLHVQTAVFQSLMQAGRCPPGDAAAMALLFYGGVFLLLHTCDSWQEAEPQFIAHVAQFTRQQGIYIVEGKSDENPNNL